QQDRPHLVGRGEGVHVDDVVLYGRERANLLRIEFDELAFFIFEARDNVLFSHSAMDRAYLLVVDRTAAIFVDLAEVNIAAAGDCGVISPYRNRNQTEPKESVPART